MDPVYFLDFLLQMGGTNIVGLIRFKDQGFHSFIDWLWRSTGLPEYRTLSRPFVPVDELIHTLTGNLYYGIFLSPLLNDLLDILIR